MYPGVCNIMFICMDYDMISMSVYVLLIIDKTQIYCPGGQ